MPRFTRGAITGALAVAVAVTSLLAPAPAVGAPNDDKVRIATDGFVYGYAPVALARTRALTLCATGVNTMLNLPVTANPLFRAVVAPNTETLYTNSFLDLRKGPVTVSYPPTGGRYMVFQFLDMYSNVIGNAGTRVDGPAGHSVTIVPPGYHGPVRGQRQIRSGTWDVWMLGRTLVSGTTIPDARTLQSSYRMSVDNENVGPTPPPLRQQGCTVSSPQNLVSAQAGFFDELADVITADPPPPADAAIVASLSSIGVRPGATPSAGPDAAALSAGVANGNAVVDNSEGMLPARGPWRTTDVAGHWGTDYLLRAFLTKVGLGINELAESRYYRATVDSAGATLTGARSYVIHVPASVPVDKSKSGWWSVTVYDMDGFPIVNPAFKYSVGTDLDGPLVRNPDGSADVTISVGPRGPVANWIPAPAGPFQLIFRQYIPTNTAWAPPPIIPV
ncbi:UNVERIFIED_CONTAM: hypothetical protein DES50_111103 [Williamsia faeni]